MESEKIKWENFNSRYVRLMPNEKKRLVLSNWRSGVIFGKNAILCSVLEEDGKKVEGMQFTITSRRLIFKLKPILEEAEKSKQGQIAVAITRLGEGFDTTYEVESLSPGKKGLFRR